EQCNTDTHRCPGCGEDVPHGAVACTPCDRRVTANKIPPGQTEDGRTCSHDDAVFGVENDRMVCAACGTPCTHPDGFTENDPVEDDGEGLVVRCALCGAVDSEDEEAHVVTDDSDDPEHADDCPGCPDDAAQGLQATLGELDRQQAEADAWRTPADLLAKMPENVRGLDTLRLNCADCGHPVTPLVDYFGVDGKAKAVTWACEPRVMSMGPKDPCRDHECKPDRLARLGDLDEADCFLRNGTLMRLTERESATSVLAEVLDGPHKGRTGALKNPDEVVERAPSPAATGPVRVGELGHGDVFMRRGTAMRVTSAGYGLVEAIVVDNGPYAGRTGE
ncbi:hypothetical protein, partial [Streptomyces sp. NPDC001781]